MAGGVLAWFILIAITSMVAYASDPDPLQDFCVATKDPDNKVFVNGHLCKNPNEVTSDDFLYKGLNIPGDINNTEGSHYSLVWVSNLPGLNTLGLSMCRFDYAASGGLVSPHTHPRSTEVLTVVEGTLYTGFISGANKLYAKVLSAGDVMVYPQGLVHFAYNVGTTNAVAYAAFNSHNPGEVRPANAGFGSDPPISVDVLSKAFQIDPTIVQDLQSKFPLIPSHSD